MKLFEVLNKYFLYNLDITCLFCEDVNGNIWVSLELEDFKEIRMVESVYFKTESHRLFYF